MTHTPPPPSHPAQVLRFWCIWDDRQSMYGDRRPYALHYFLEDDTVSCCLTLLQTQPKP